MTKWLHGQKRYLCLIKGGMMDKLTFKASIIINIFGNLIYTLVVYFLWQGIYDSNTSLTVNGMSFQDTMVYLVLASAMFYCMNCYIVWDMGDDYKRGQIARDIVKPIDYQAYLYFKKIGEILIQFIVSFLPTFIFVYFITNGLIHLGTNLIWFILSLLFSITINFIVDFIIGNICFYTQSVWGINLMKEVIVLLLSGASIPLAFFPTTVTVVTSFLPFHAIYNTPLQILIKSELNWYHYITMFGWQLFWLIVMLFVSRYFWKKSIKTLTINGG